MALKVDKDFLLKHRFWILTGVFVILAIVPLFMLTTSVSATVTQKQKEYDDAKKSVEGIGPTAPNDKWVEAFTTQDGFVASKVADLHSEAWKSQKSMMTYPDPLVAKMRDKRFGDPIPLYELDEYGREYKSQLRETVIDVQPLLPLEGFQDGIVQFPGNNMEGVLRLGVDFTPPPPSREDFWLAQEDLWVKRELLRILRGANDLVAKFHALDELEAAAAEKKAAEAAAKAAEEAAKSGADAKPVDGSTPATKPAPKAVQKKPVDLNHRIFRNQHWQLDLTLKNERNEKNRPIVKLAGTITNVGSRRRALGVQFKVLLQPGANSSGILLPVDREPLGVGETWTIPPQTFTADKVAFQGLFGVEEVLTWKTAPVKRIDVIELCYGSSRLAHRTLKPPRWYTPPVVEDPAAGAGEGGGMGMGRKEMASIGMGGPGGGATAAPTTKSGLNLNRYIDTNDQVRHMPIGMVVVADDEHIAELLSAFSNSPLRVQVTQCHWQVCHDKLTPTTEESVGTPSSGTGSGKLGGMAGMAGIGGGVGQGPGGGMGRRGRDEDGRNGMYRGGGKNMNMGGQMVGPIGGAGNRPGSLGGPGRLGMGGAGMGAGSEGEEELSMNLLEVSVYGIASLYEKFPPAKPAAEGGTDATGAATGTTNP
ncbi:hypothetical protein BH10PLA2_BH10PLA2_18970 [soil metagenome]